MHSPDRTASRDAEYEVMPARAIGLLDVALALSFELRALIVVPLLFGVCVFASTFALTPRYTARSVIMPPQQQQSAAAAALQNLGTLAGLAGASGGIKSPADQYVSLMQSRTVQDRLIDQFQLTTAYDERIRTDTRIELEKRTRISAGKKDGLITIEVEDVDPDRAAAMANAYVAELKRMTTELAITEAQQRRAFFERQLNQTRDRFSAAQKALQSSGFNEGALRAEPRASAEGYAKLRAEATALEVRLRAMRVSLTDNAPEIQQALEQLSLLRSQLAKVESTNASASQGDYVDRYREFKYQEALYELFAKQFEIAKIDESRDGAIVQVVDPAVVPERKSWPRRFVFASVAAFVLSMLLVGYIILRTALVSADADSASKASLLAENLRRAMFLRHGK